MAQAAMLTWPTWGIYFFMSLDLDSRLGLHLIITVCVWATVWNERPCLMSAVGKILWSLEGEKETMALVDVRESLCCFHKWEITVNDPVFMRKELMVCAAAVVPILQKCYQFCHITLEHESKRFCAQ